MSAPVSQARRFSALKCASTCFSTTVIITGTVILIWWLATRPKTFDYTVERAAIHGYNLSGGPISGYEELSGNFTFTVKAKNPNRKVSIYYDSIDATLGFDLVTIGKANLSSFYQPKDNSTEFELFFPVDRHMLSGEASRDFRNSSSRTGKVNVDLTIFAKIRFRVWFFKTKHWMKLMCSPDVPVTSHREFKRDSCVVLM